MRKRMLIVPLAIAGKKYLTEERRDAIKHRLEQKVPDRVGPVVIREPKKSRKRGALKFTLAAAIGAALAYFFDAERGRARRTKAKDMTAARLRRGRERARGVQIRAENKLEGVRHELTRGTYDLPNDPTLAHKVESEVLRDFPSGRINVNAEDGRVVLRGVLDRPEQIRELEDRVRHVDGVVDVENLVHLVGTDARR
jgi:hypothetical protein